MLFPDALGSVLEIAIGTHVPIVERHQWTLGLARTHKGARGLADVAANRTYLIIII
jgi:hypothetical protein